MAAKVISVVEAVRQFGYSLPHLYGLLRTRKLAAQKDSNGKWVIPVEELKKLPKLSGK